MGNEMRGQFFGLSLIPGLILGVIGIIGVIIMAIGIRTWWRKRESKDVGKLVTVDQTDTKEEFTVRDAVDLPKHMWTAKVLRFFIYLCLAGFAWLLLGLVWFDYLPIGAGIPITTIYLWVCWFFILPYHDDVPMIEAINSFSLASAKIWVLHKVGYAYRKIKSRPYLFFFGCIFQFLVVFIACFFGEGMCVMGQPDMISTRFTRRNNPPTCAGAAPCHIYLTLSEDPTTSIFVNFHIAGTTVTPGIVYWDVVSHAQSTTMSDYPSKKDSVALAGDYYELNRTIHYVHLSGLTPDTTYYFRAGRGSDMSSEKSFRTPPLESPYNFASGGDMGVSEVMQNLSSLAAKQDPLFITVGGDLSYADGMFTCYPRWDHWLSLWEELMVDTKGRLIPMILSLGNHEAGGYGAPPDQIPFYSQWFPQNGDGTPSTRKTYHHHQFGDEMVFIVLDSNINLPPNDPGQMEFLEASLSLNVSKKFTTYHVPLYPSVRAYEGSLNAEERQYWGPLFDKYDLTVSFENHDHYYKRTKRMIDSVEDPDGTVYIGDGCWGAVARAGAADPTRFYIEKVEATEHYLKVDITPTTTTVSATDVNGKVFDQTTV